LFFWAQGRGSDVHALNSVTVPRFVPMAITAKTTPKKDGNIPYAFRTSGRVLPPAGVSEIYCEGTLSER
jgi:hypothetical protein